MPYQKVPMTHGTFKLHVQMDYEYSKVQIHSDVEAVCKELSYDFIYNDGDIYFKSRDGSAAIVNSKMKDVIDNINYVNEFYRTPLASFSCINGKIV